MRDKPKYEVFETDTFVSWIEGIKDCVYRQKIAAQILKLANGNFGNVKSLKDGLFEAKEKKGSGFRLYFINRDGKIIILLCGGDKSSQQSDIKNARKLAKEY